MQELMFATSVDEKWRFAEEFARQVMARVQRKMIFTTAPFGVRDVDVPLTAEKILRGIHR